MAIDFLILALLIISLTINLLALGAFWVTPGLRTTANRFVINLLVVNIIGCLTLAPTLFLTGAYRTSSLRNVEGKDIKNLDPVEKSLLFYESTSLGKDVNTFLNNKENITSNEGNNSESVPVITKKLVKCRGNSSLDCEKISIVEKKNSNAGETDETVVTEMEFIGEDDDDEDNNNSNSNNGDIDLMQYDGEIEVQEEENNKENEKNNYIRDGERRYQYNNKEIIYTKNFNFNSNEENFNSEKNFTLSSRNSERRCWSLDLAAALGAFSVLLVVGDTWCAVTDPLRYHSRISRVKAWILIISTWLICIFFGVLSALREIVFTESRGAEAGADIEAKAIFSFTPNELYNMIYSCVYFIVIILLPFGFVCGMYWRIFSEAKENGLRMRQNGSSPLIQSALNLAATSSTSQQQKPQSEKGKDCGNYDGLTMNIDSRRSSNERESLKPLLPPLYENNFQLNSENYERILIIKNEKNQNSFKQDRNQNILLTLSKPTTESDDIKRNYSDRQLSILGSSSEDFCYSDENLNDGNYRQQEFHYKNEFQHNKSTNNNSSNNNNNNNNNNCDKSIRQVHSSPDLKQLQKENNNGSDNSFSLFSLGIIKNSASTAASTSAIKHSVDRLSLSSSIQRNALQLPSSQLQPSSTPPRALSYMTSIRHRLSNASSLFKYREESRAARISILVVIMFLISYLPYGLIVLLQGRLMNLITNSTQIATFLVLMGNLSSPFIFAYRNKRVRRGVKRLFGLDKKSKENKHNFGLLKPGTKASINVRRTAAAAAVAASNNNKISSVNSCKLLTPNIINNDGSFIMEIIDNKIPTLTSQQMYLQNEQQEYEKEFEIVVTNAENNKEQFIGSSNNCNSNPTISITSPKNAFIRQTLKISERKSFLKIVYDSSRKLGCSTKSCTSIENEQVDV